MQARGGGADDDSVVIAATVHGGHGVGACAIDRESVVVTPEEHVDVFRRTAHRLVRVAHPPGGVIDRRRIIGNLIAIGARRVVGDAKDGLVRGDELIAAHLQPGDGHGGQLPIVRRAAAEDIEHVAHAAPIALAKERGNAGDATAGGDVDHVVAISAQHEGRDPGVDATDGDLVIARPKSDIEITAALSGVGKAARDSQAGDRSASRRGIQRTREPRGAPATTDIDAVRVAVVVDARLDRKASGDARQIAGQDAERIESLGVVAIAAPAHEPLFRSIARDVEAVGARAAASGHRARHGLNEKPVVGGIALEHGRAGRVDATRP